MPNRLASAQIRGARAMLGWSMADLAKASKVSISTVKRMEMEDPQSVSIKVHEVVREALEKAGARFLDHDGHGIGIWVDPR